MRGKQYTADFETTTDPTDCRVWAFGISQIGDPKNFIYGNSIEEFMELCETTISNSTLYFHNAKFDFQFIISYLLNNGFTHIGDRKEKADQTFTTLITDTGQFFSLEIYFKVKNKHVTKIKMLDSLKILNFSVEKIAKDFDLPIQKLELDYETKRERGHILTEHEIHYLRNDVEVMSRALKIMFDQNLKKMTIASDAISEFKDLFPDFKSYFPILPFDLDRMARASYKGGFTYLSPLYKEQQTGAGIVFDKNSMYPAKMKQEILPVGEPMIFEGKYKFDFAMPLYIQFLTCTFNLKPGKIPSIQIKNQPFFKANEYLENSGPDFVELALTSVDLELFLENYDVDIVSWDGGLKFMGMSGVFNDYIDKWTENKIKAKAEHNGSLYTISKLMLNSLYGKFGLNPRCAKKVPFLGDDGVVKYKRTDIEERDPIYVPVASYITSYAMADIIRSSQQIRDFSLNKYGKDAYIYSDTDSIHCLLSREDLPELSKFMDIDDYRLGAWKLESEFSRGKYLRQKCYIEEDLSGEITATIAGLPKRLGKLINFDNFRVGFSTTELNPDEVQKLGNKLTYKYVPGGVVLIDTDFEIK